MRAHRSRTRRSVSLPLRDGERGEGFEVFEFFHGGIRKPGEEVGVLQEDELAVADVLDEEVDDFEGGGAVERNGAEFDVVGVEAAVEGGEVDVLWGWSGFFFFRFDLFDLEGAAGAGDVAGGDGEVEFVGGFFGGRGVGFFGDVGAVFGLVEPDVEEAGLLEGEVVWDCSVVVESGECLGKNLCRQAICWASSCCSSWLAPVWASWTAGSIQVWISS